MARSEARKTPQEEAAEATAAAHALKGAKLAQVGFIGRPDIPTWDGNFPSPQGGSNSLDSYLNGTNTLGPSNLNNGDTSGNSLPSSGGWNSHW